MNELVFILDTQMDDSPDLESMQETGHEIINVIGALINNGIQKKYHYEARKFIQESYQLVHDFVDGDNIDEKYSFTDNEVLKWLFEFYDLKDVG